MIISQLCKRSARALCVKQDCVKGITVIVQSMSIYLHVMHAIKRTQPIFVAQIIYKSQ